ncbi:hypothetical protein DL764_007284 [Monosporascus ibericus]|uniref:Putative transcription factor kapC n=1 Tax=Monosporascus ibericus TaxID=155417 RepID=A0A4Q4T2F9_9PEZI|nr:hypothetical protein DL764_007284 [Monosporascus ibericus]
MDEIEVLTNPSSPVGALYHAFNDAEPYFDSANTSTTTSPMNSHYDLSFHMAYQSPELSSEECSRSETQESNTKAPAKRKRENRYKNAPPSVLSRRRAQNRASQRAYRERKDQRIKDLEALLNDAHQKNSVLTQAYAALQAEYMKLKSEQGTANQFQQAGLTYDPIIAAAEMDMYLYNDASGYTV